MKKIITTAFVLVFSIFAQAQSKLVNYFKKLPKEMQQGFTITKNGNGFSADAGTGPCKLTLDEANGFLEIIDDGTGGGTTTYQIAIFKKASGKEIVAVNFYGCCDVRENGTLALYNGSDMQEVTKELIDDITKFEYEAIKDVGDELNQYFGDRGPYTYFVLPQKGTTIMLYYGANGLDKACDDNDKKACAIKKKLHAVPMYWRKEAGDNSFFSVSKD